VVKGEERALGKDEGKGGFGRGLARSLELWRGWRMSAEHSKPKRDLRSEILSNFDMKELQKLTEMQEPPSLAESFVDASKTFGMGLVYSFVDPATICMLVSREPQPGLVFSI
jgi:hypothetical protein